MLAKMSNQSARYLAGWGAIQRQLLSLLTLTLNIELECPAGTAPQAEREVFVDTAGAIK
jgi:hypothetical protein